MAFDMSNYVDVAERIRLAMEKWPLASFQNIETKVIEIAGHFFVSATVELYRTPDDIRPARATAWEPIPGATPYTKDSEMMNAETSAMGRAVIAAGIPSKKIASVQDVIHRQPLAVVKDEPPQKDPWTGEIVTHANPDETPTCQHGLMKYWQSPKTGAEMYFCQWKEEAERCEVVKV